MKIQNNNPNKNGSGALEKKNLRPNAGKKRLSGKLAWILGACLFVGLMAGAVILYNNFADDYKPDNFVILGGKDEQSTTSQNKQEPEQGSADSGSETENESETDSPYLAPDFTVYDLDGKAVKLSDFRGKPIVLNFWASDCPYCVKEMPDFQAAYEKYRDDVTFLMVCITGFANRTAEHEQEFIKGLGYTFPTYYDTDQDALYTYGTTSLPLTYFIDRDFDLYTYIPGMADADTLEKCIGMILQR